jgi:dephospho-CoA kinase
MEAAFDATIAVIADEDLRAARAAGRGHDALDERLARQLTQQDKAHRATYVIANDGDIRELEANLSSVLDILDP